MHKTLIKSLVLVCLALFPTAPQLRADTVTDHKLGFTLTLSPEFISRPDLIVATPDIVHPFQCGEATEGDIAVLLLIEQMGGVMGRERLKKQDMPPSFKEELFATRWQGLEIDGIEVPESVNGTPTVTYNVQVPLRGEAILVKLFGPADRAEALNYLLQQILDNLKQ